MSKYWNEARIQRIRQRKQRREKKLYARAAAAHEQSRRKTPGDSKKNTCLVLEALGPEIRRKLVSRLMKEGTMSLSKLAEPFRITLPTAEFHLDVLERAGLVRTKKQGRVRLCTYEPTALAETAKYFQRRRPDLS